jgi:general secretion pathway protein G
MTAYRTYRSSVKRGFTLVEILIVVIILGILAAIVIPQFTNASQDARRSSLASTVQTLRSQIELYKLQHGDTLPDLVTDWTPFTGTTQYGSPAKNFGPYMQNAPENQLMESTAVKDGTAYAAGDVEGFVYDYNGGNGSGRMWGIDKYVDDQGAVAYRLLGD